MKQVVTIHGGEVYKTYDEYIAGLRAYTLDDPTIPSAKGWRTLLGERLGAEYLVISPRMPNAANAHYIEWKIWFEKHIPFLDDGVVLLGHSLGACFLTRYLSEEHCAKKIAGTFLVAGSLSEGADGHLTEFVPHGPLTRLAQQAGHIFLYHSKDDEVVPFSELAQYRAALPHATVRIFEDQNHFIGDDIPGLVADIHSLARLTI